MYMYDGGPAHFSVIVPDYLQALYPNRWIGRRGIWQWPARSPISIVWASFYVVILKHWGKKILLTL